MRLQKTLHQQSKWLVLVESLILIGLIGWFDYATGWEWSFFAPFAVPIALVTWKAGLRVGLGCAVICALVFMVAHLGNHPYQTVAGFALAVFGRWFYFTILVVAVDSLKTQRKLDQARILSLERARELESQVLDSTDREQQRIGRELHDNLGTHLAAVGYATTFLANELREHERPEAAKAEQIRELVGDAVSLTREMARGIFPVQMDFAGLSPALEDLARNTSSRTGLEVAFYETGSPQAVRTENGMHLYRIVQEALNNALKHGKPRKITIILNNDEDSLRLAVADDGKGIEISSIGKHSMGLDSMRYRAGILGGELKIESHPGEGTIVTCEIPKSPIQA
jgi:signal transduction histidine kinase